MPKSLNLHSLEAVKLHNFQWIDEATYKNVSALIKLDYPEKKKN